MNTKYIFIDIDGTLVGYDSKIPDSALEALKLAQKNGHKVIICSGRPLYMIYPELLSAVKFDGIIASGGACVVVDGKVIFESLIRGESLKNVIDYFRREGIYYLVQSKDMAYAEKEFRTVVIPGMIADGYNEELVEQAYEILTIVDDVTVIEDAEKVSYFGSPYSPDKISSDLGGKYYVVDFSVGNVKTKLAFGELNNADATKATGIEQYIRHVGACREDTIAIGDSGNDLEMINYAGYSVAMGNATEQIKAAADFITTAVDKDGIHNAFLKLGLI
jgi:Cof subfamily protein (haloacid dehalogenase superfamily)